MAKKTTLATIKAFIRKNAGNGLHILPKSSFDGMVDCVMPVDGDWIPVNEADFSDKYTLGCPGAWFVGQSRDYFDNYAADGWVGYRVFNSCGSFILAVNGGN